MKRLKHIDTAKGLGIILVVWGHSLIEFGHYIIYMFHMPLFFYLSGIFHRQGGYVELLSKKFRGLIVPLVIFMVILFPVSYMVDDQCAVNLAPPPPFARRVRAIVVSYILVLSVGNISSDVEVSACCKTCGLHRAEFSFGLFAGNFQFTELYVLFHHIFCFSILCNGQYHR